jgi:hypothetical protein
MKKINLLLLCLVATPALAEEMSPGSITCSGTTPRQRQTVEITQSFESYTSTVTEDSTLSVKVDGARPTMLAYETLSSSYISPLAGQFLGLLLINEAGEPMITVEHVAEGNAANSIAIMRMLLTNDTESANLGEQVMLENVRCTITRGE